MGRAPGVRSYGVSQEQPLFGSGPERRGSIYWTNGVEPGDGILRVLTRRSNAGDANKFNASDEDNGGAPRHRARQGEIPDG